ncbi:MAG: sel1 repeat family protein [Verrucomicrobia bacterium]|nr:sel1 repeat family protein [Verrucomicrobiota bacterium]
MQNILGHGLRALLTMAAMAQACLAQPVGICLKSYSPLAPPDKMECFEFERHEPAGSNTRFFIDGSFSVLVRGVELRGILFYPKDAEMIPDYCARRLPEFETRARESPATRRYLNPWIIRMRNVTSNAANVAEAKSGLPDITLRDGTVLQHCKVLKRETAKVSISHDGGVRGVPVGDLDAGALKALAIDTIPVTTPERVSEENVVQTPASSTSGMVAGQSPIGDSGNNAPALDFLTNSANRAVPKLDVASDAPDAIARAQLLMKLAAMGDAQSQRLLAFCYDYGHGVPMDKEAATKWFKRAADQGDPISQASYGLRSDLGVDSLMWLELAKNGGVTTAEPCARMVRTNLPEEDLQKVEVMVRAWRPRIEPIE